MSFFIAATYVILVGLIIYLLTLLSSQRPDRSMETRDNMLTNEELQKHAVEMARNHQVGRSAKSLHWLIRRLNDNYSFIEGVYRALNKDFNETFPTSPAAEWLLDNFYIIEEQVKLIRKNLSRAQYSRLPALKRGYLKGYPRVYAIALEMVAHSDGLIDEKTITGFIDAYQAQALLSMGELWATPLMLCIALVESIRNICDRIDSSRAEWHKAESIALYIASNESDEQKINAVLNEQLGDAKEISSSFIEHLVRRLRKHGSRGMSTVTALLDLRLKEENSSTEKITGLEHQLQASMQVSIGNSITGLRLISDIDWTEIFESLCKVEQILRQDPCGIYALMDFESRDQYRHEVEKLARAYRTSEINVADKTVVCANSGIGKSPQDHVGYYLVGKGRSILTDTLGRTAAKSRRPAFAPVKRNPGLLYFSLIVFLTVFLISYFMYYSYSHSGGNAILWSVAAAIAVAVPCSELSLNIINTILSHVFKPTTMPKLELKEGVPPQLATIVIIPTLLTNEARVKDLLLQLEVYYLANKENNLYFALVGDYKDADAAEQSLDDPIAMTAIEGIKSLNKKYPGDRSDIFYYMQRERLYNKPQNRWMGWERKRGAVVEFNKLLRGSEETSFSIISGDISKLLRIKYVITLDADTNLPMGAARRLIGTIAHPLNRAVVDEKTGIVSEGYGLLQPRISISIPSANRSLFTKIFAGQGGIDPYTTAVSDIYQDLFGEGIFTGKGIYELDVFRRVLEDRLPDNSILSHDLLEGCHLRAGLVTDIELVDGFPARYNSYAARQHRWVRGDWQLLPWLSGSVRKKDGEKAANNLSGLSKWKIFDNLRRSLLSPSLLVLIFAGFGLLPGNYLVWSGFALLVLASPLSIGILNTILSGSIRFKSHRADSTAITGARAAFYQSILLLMFLPFQAYLMLDAVIRTIYRISFSHKKMLEWVTAADVEASIKNNSGSFYSRMWFNIPASLAIFLLAVFSSQDRIYFAICIAALWLAAPLAAYIISKPYVKKKRLLPENDFLLLRRIARKTWRYFEDFAAARENYLPPDNFQEDPLKGTAHRTSPTNIGLLLVSVLSACDMGYIGEAEMAERLDKILTTIESMDKWKGHLYNWYNTITLERLRPLYVSTVDSGNFVGCMMVVRMGLEEYLGSITLKPSMAQGLADAIALACEETGINEPCVIKEKLRELASCDKIDIKKWNIQLNEVKEWLVECGAGGSGYWMDKLASMAESFSNELYTFYPALLFSDDAASPTETAEETSGSPGAGSDADTSGTVSEMSGIPGICANNGCGIDMDELYLPGTIDELLKRYSKVIELMERKPERENDVCAIHYGESCESSSTGIASKSSCYGIIDMLKTSCGKIEAIREKYLQLVERLGKLIDETEFKTLFNHKRLLFHIGYDIDDGHPSKSHYDLLASESRQASYIAIARNEVDRKHWYRLGRKMTASECGKGLVSWTGTMFEYLMPYLFMRSYENTIFDETYSFVVRAQRKYGKLRRIPWGISESGYSALDFNLNYQYKAFGIPELGLKRGLANDMVVSPYSAMLALCIEPTTVVENLKILKSLGMDGSWGYYEAIDFTPSRLDKNTKYHIVKSFMAHHQGMALAALNNFFYSNILQERFHSDPVNRSAELLLQEKSPDKALYAKEYKADNNITLKRTEQGDGEAVRTYGVPSVLPPNAHILSNGEYSVMVTDGGYGYSVSGGIALTRWARDYFRKTGFYIFIQNINSNTAWSATYDPMLIEPEKYKVVFSPDKAEFYRRDGNLETYTEITVSPEDNAEVRRVSITNHSSHVRIVELTSYLEAVLLPGSEDAAHPAFSKLFVRTEFIKNPECILASRRQRKPGQPPLWLLHTIAVEGENAIGDIQYETDRMRFIGRNRSIDNPEALEPDQPLSNSEGSVLDPIMSLRRRIRIEPGETVRVVFSAAAALTKEQALELAEKYNSCRNSERVFELSWTRSQVEARYFGLNASEIEFYLELVPLIIYNNPLSRNNERHIAENLRSQHDLWTFGISGDLPVILVEVSDIDDMDMVYWALKGHEYWRMKGLTIDLVILADKKEGYTQPLQEQIRNAVASSHARELSDKHGGVFTRSTSTMDSMQKSLFYAIARLVVRDSVEVFKNEIRDTRKAIDAALREGLKQTESIAEKTEPIFVHQASPQNKLMFFNGIGGFSSDGTEYVIKIEKGRHTPAPWSNVIANKKFGFLVTESGGGYTWAFNSRENKLTPWSNDPVTDQQGEVFYIYDFDESRHWSLTPMPAGDNQAYIVRHGRGYSVFEHNSFGVNQSLTLFAAADEPVKICIVALRNLTGRKRNLSVTYYLRPVLGVNDDLTSPYIFTRKDENGLLMIENKFSNEFQGKIAFLCTNVRNNSVTGDRVSFLGLKGDIAEPSALKEKKLNGLSGAGLDPCAAVCAKIELEPEEEHNIIFLFGQVNHRNEISVLTNKFLKPDMAKRELDVVKQNWNEKLEAIQVRTPDDSLDIMLNGWLMYQIISCRLWARSAYYQAGGAFGFRDQLQDSMAVLNTLPEKTRNQILLHASRQYREGDVQHWWHAESGKGIRTRYSDDLLWLAFVTAEYVDKTGDTIILKEMVPFLESNVLEEDEDERYEKPIIAEQAASLYEHCVIAIDKALETGSHGIPLMGGGDWNDGMNTVGNKGKGESVWLGWFIITILNKFIPICRLMKDYRREEEYQKAIERLTESIEREAWDGSWYRRAYFDDGTPLGSAQNSECRIDSISQSWSAISGVAKPQRMAEAMDAVLKYLVNRNEGIIKLLTPPFDNGNLQPGYIKGYVPGVRENGGQYTHAAAWVVLAFTKLGMGDIAGELFHMLNPVNHTRTSIEYSRYKGEPYVVAADVYGEKPHTGRGGWTWYTGAAGWLYKVGIENIIGFKKKGNKLYIEPCIPRNWNSFEIKYRTSGATYHIEVKNPDLVSIGTASIFVDGKLCPEGYISLANDGGFHRVVVVMGKTI